MEVSGGRLSLSVPTSKTVELYRAYYVLRTLFVDYCAFKNCLIFSTFPHMCTLPHIILHEG